MGRQDLRAWGQRVTSMYAEARKLHEEAAAEERRYRAAVMEECGAPLPAGDC